MGICDCLLDFGKFRDYFETAIHEPNGKTIIDPLASRNPVEVCAEGLQIEEFCCLFNLKIEKKLNFHKNYMKATGIPFVDDVIVTDAIRGLEWEKWEGDL